MKIIFEVKWKGFFLALQVLWFILTKQTIKNVADATFQMNLDLKNL